MIRLRSALACIYVFALLAAAMSAAAQTPDPNWQLIDIPDESSGGPTTQSEDPAVVTEHVYLIHNEAGINASPLPDIIKEDLLPPLETSGGGAIPVTLEEEDGEDFYVVSQEIVEGIVASENAGVLTPEIDAISEPLDPEESLSSSSSGITAKSIFGGSCATRQQTIHRVINLTDKTYTKNFDDLGNGFSGSISLTGQITGTVTADITLDIKRRNTLGKCVPYSVRFKNLHAFGNATSTGGITLTGTLNYSDTFGPWPIADPELFDYWTVVWYIPVRIVGTLPITAGLGVTGNVTGTINYNGNHVATGNFDYNCTLSNCTGTHSFNNSPDNLDQQITGGITGHIKPDAWVDASFRVSLYSSGFAHAQVGVRGHLLGDLWGFDGNNCGDADGANGNETVRALTFDLDRRIDILGKAEVFGDNVWDHIISNGEVKHVGFYDLINSTAMQPQLHGPASLDKRDPGEYKVRMRPCWPYTDPVKYRLNWGDGSAVQELQGAPATEVTASHTWDTAGNKTVTANSWQDDHGRSLDQTTSRTIEVKEPTPLDVTVTPSPVSATYGTTITWTATATGGHPASTQYALFRRPAGATAWTPPVNAPAWQTSNVLTWMPSSAETGVWEIIVWVKDRNTAPDANGYGYADYVHAGNVQVVPPLTVSCSAPSPATVTYGNPVTWTATAAGGTPGTIQFMLSRQMAGTSTWTSTPWQPSNTFSWTPAAADVGTWQVYITVKDLNTPADPGYTASCNGGQPKVVSPLSVTVTPSPAQAGAGNAINWTATATGGVPASTQYALFRRRAGTTPWTPDVTAPAWQASNALSWTPAASDAGTWEIIVWVKDGNTPATMNTYGFAAYANAGPVEVKAPLAMTVTAPPAYSIHGNPITVTATATGGDTATIQYTLARRRVGSADWLPSPLVFQSGNALTWTPTAADVGSWELGVGVRDRNTPPGANTFGVSAYAFPGTVQVVAPLSLSVTASPAQSVYGNAITWTATASGGVPATTRFAFFRRRSGTTPWTPDVTAPSWQTSNVFTWTPTSADVGSWDVYVWVKDSLTPSNQNTYGYAAGANAGGVQVVTAPLTLTVTPSPQYATAGNAITWTATAGGGTPSTTRYALFRRRAGATAWTPDVTAPAWQTSNVLSWTTTASDAGTWEIIIWVKDGDTPATMNTYGFAAYHNSGPVQVVAPLGLTVTPSPESRPHNDTRLITWTATASGGVPGTLQYAFFRRRAGATAWTPAVTAPAWQTSNSYSWDPGPADVGTWETYVWVKDSLTPANMNTYGYAAGHNSGPVTVTAPLCLSATASPSYVNTGTAITWTATPCGGYPPTTQLALFRRRVGATAWIPDVSAPAWQSSNVFTWTPATADAGTWEILLWVRDDDTPPSPGYGATYNPGNVQVVTPMTVTGTGSPQYANYGNTINWTANASGGNPSTYRYAFFRRRAGATAYIPDVTAPAWQTSNVMSWTPSSSDVGTWEIIIWAKDGNTPATMNTYGFAAYYNAQPVQVIAPLGLTVSSSNPSTVYSGTTLSWTANGSGGVSSTRQYAFFRRRAGTTPWTPSVTSPAWQTSNNFTWTPSSADTGTWELLFWVKDSTTPSNQNTYGYAASYTTGTVQVLSPPTVTGTTSPSTSPYGATISWTATASGGDASSMRYAIFRRRAGTTSWTPDVTTPSWQSSRTFSWTPTSADVGTWEVFIWVKDAYTPPNMNTYGHAAWYNAGTVQVVTPAPLTVSGSGSPSTSPAGTSISWTANTSGGVPSTVRYALFRRRAGTSNWIPDVTAPSWQTSNVLRWTPSAADVGTWEIIIWVKDVNTTPTQNGYGFAAYYNAQPVQVY